MTTGANRTAVADTPELTFDSEIETPRLCAFTVGVRRQVGEDLEGLEAHGDGISFLSPEPIAGGRIIELVICRTILVQAKVVGCALMPGGEGGYWVRALFHQTTPELNRLISEELQRMIEAVR
jgi:hypothetical protein